MSCEDHYQRLLQFLEFTTISKRPDVESIDLTLALQGFLQKYAPEACDDENDVQNSFAQASCIIEASTSVYAKKVDALAATFQEIARSLTTKREASAMKKKKFAVNDERYDDDFHDIMDSVKIGNHINLTEQDETNKEPIDYIIDPPSCMVGLIDNSSPASRIPIFNLEGKKIGHKSDFALGAYTHSSTGQLSFLMQTDDASLGDQSRTGLELHYDTALESPEYVEDVLPSPGSAEASGESSAIDKTVAKEKQGRKIYQEKIARCLEPHDPYSEVTLRERIKPPQKIHERIRNTPKRRSRKAAMRFFDRQIALGKEYNQPDNVLIKEGNLEFLARKKTFMEYRDASHFTNEEETDEEDGYENNNTEDICVSSIDPDLFDRIAPDLETEDHEIALPFAVAQSFVQQRWLKAKTLQNSEESKKVFEEWETKISSVLHRDDECQIDIRKSMDDVLHVMKSKSEPVKFNDMIPMKTPWDVSRLFLSTLFLASNNNLDLFDPKKDNLPADYTAEHIPVNDLKVSYVTADHCPDVIGVRNRRKRAAEEESSNQLEEQSSSSSPAKIPRS